jgi:hypothetical protein
VKGPSGFGAPKQQRIAMPFSYDARPSFWQKVKSNSHLVIAAVGTVALLGVAGTALWLAMPAGDRQAFAQVEQPAAAAGVPAEPAKTEAAGQPASASTESPAAATAGSGAVTLPAAEAQDDVATLQASDPRWSGSTHKQARTQAEAAAQAQKEAAPATIPAPPPVPTPEQAAAVAAYQSAPSGDDTTAPAKPDKAETAAIHAAEPAKPAPAQDAAENGHILRAVTMRSGPKKGASAIGTIPAKAGVQVISCKSWCEVVYQGRHGFIYKSFLRRGG